jgi:hypothetical protein
VSFSTALQQIESHDFAAYLGVANNLEMLYTLATQEQGVGELAVLLRDHAVARNLLAHVASIIREQEDVRYRNPRDAAIAVYIWMLAQTQPALALLAAGAALNAPRLWWAKKAALSVTSGTWMEGTAEAKAHTLMAKAADWKDGGAGRKDVLIISDPSEDLIRQGRVLDPDLLNLDTNTMDSQNMDAGYSTTGSSERTEVIQK